MHGTPGSLQTRSHPHHCTCSAPTALMPPEKWYRCTEPGCDATLSHEKNISRHLRMVHRKQTRGRGRPKKIISDLTESHNAVGQHEVTSLRASRGPQPSSWSTGNSWPSSEEWWAHQLGVHGRPYHWNRDGLLQKLLRLPRLGQQGTKSEHGLARIMSASELPTKSEADALLAFHNRTSGPLYSRRHRFDHA